MMAKAEDEGTVCCGSDGDFERTEMLFAKVVAEMAQEMNLSAFDGDGQPSQPSHIAKYRYGRERGGKKRNL